MQGFLDWIRANTNRTVRRVVVGIVGGSVVLAGLALLVLPGPGVVVILLGLGFLSLEFAIANTWIAAVKRRAGEAADRANVPRSVLWVLPVAGIGLSVVFAVIPGFVSIVHGAGTWELVRKPELSWRWNYVAQADLAAAAPTDPLAAGILARTTRWPAALNAAPAVPAVPAPPAP